jgi:hypothetical protein
VSASTALIGSQAFQSIAGGISANNQSRAQARALDENARLTDLQGEYDVLSALRKSRMEDGAMLAEAAAGGGGGGAGAGGSMADILYANAVQRQMEALNIRNAAANQARGLRAQASQARADGRAAIFNGVARAGAAVISGIENKRASDRLSVQAGRERAPIQPLGTIPVPRSSGLVEPTPEQRRRNPNVNW